MSALDRLDEEQKLAVVSFPYKAGIWISHSDDVDGEDDDEAEMRALEASLSEVTKLHESSALLQEVTENILAHKSAWPQWENASFHVVREAPGVIDIIVDKFGPAQAKEYRAMVLEVCATVARAHNEFSAFEEEEEPAGFLGGLVTKIASSFSGMSQDDDDHPMNVSPAEDAALSELSLALKVKE